MPNPPPRAGGSGSVAQALGAPELVKRPEYVTAPDRSKNRKALNAEIGKLTEKKSTDSWVNELNDAGIPCGPIYSIDRTFEDAQVKHLGIALKSALTFSSGTFAKNENR
jgi:crotonobetainyl-CoA:carnitine CoA-transferase CaiB-like acyl-CoA transferase